MKAPQLCVGAVSIDNEQILLVRRGRGAAAGTWSVPGGRVEFGEAMAEAVVRELSEETGLDGVCGPLVGWVEWIDQDQHFLIFDFEVTILDPSLPRAGDDAVEVCWVPLPEVAELNLAPGLAEFLHDHGIITTFS